MSRDWTVMVYMAGDNNLDNQGMPDLYEMKRAGSTDEVAILAQFDRAGTGNLTHRYFLRHWGEPGHDKLFKDIVDTLPEGNTGSPEELTDFIKWGIEFAPAEKYMVIIWAHGTGAYDEDIYYADDDTMRPNIKRHGVFRPAFANQPVTLEHSHASITADALSANDPPLLMTAIAPDDTNKDLLDNVELKKALNDAVDAVGKRIDILGMDACLMSMAEVCYQIRESVDFTVASEAEQDLDGWPYEGFLSRLVDDPAMSPRQLAETIVNEYEMKYGEVVNAAATLAACDIRSPLIDDLVEKTEALASMLKERFDSIEDAVLLARHRCWENELIESVDLSDFCKVLRSKTGDAEVKALCTDIVEFIKEAQEGDEERFIVKETRVGSDVRFTRGLGIYFPLTEVSPLYRHLDMTKTGAPSWSDFIERFVAETAPEEDD